ncbi:MAG TPA: hypothetical protein VLG11_00495 [Candidatus Saccharimonadales bacterium]|nr:hypothetical protein [Candidatus Saccharimonadales bacterium]
MFELVRTAEVVPEVPREVYVTPQGEWQIGSDMRMGRPFREVAEPYFAAQTAEHYDLVADLAEQMRETATPAFLDCKSPTKITPVPVGAHQEYDHIGRSLAQYRTQDVPVGRISLYCNWPKDANQHDASRTIDVIRAFQDKYPDLPVAYCMRMLKHPPTIGEARKTAHDASLFDERQSMRTDDILVFNHDGDITKLNSGHYRLMDTAFRRPAPVPTTLVFPRLRHQRLPGGHLPNMDSVIAWDDWYVTRMGCYYEMGCGVSARGSMAAGGIKPELRRGEILDLIATMHQGKRSGHISAKAVPGAYIETAARHLYALLGAYVSPINFWKGNLSATDVYRVQSPYDVVDIPYSIRDTFIEEIVYAHEGVLKRVILEEGDKMGLRDDARFDRWERIMHLAKVAFGGEPNIKR